jgi:hypothetical protein
LNLEFYKEDPSALIPTGTPDVILRDAGSRLFVANSRYIALDYIPGHASFRMSNADIITQGGASTFGSIRATTDWRGTFVVARLSSDGFTQFDDGKDAVVHSFAKSLNLDNVSLRTTDGRYGRIAGGQFTELTYSDGSKGIHVSVS